MESGVPDNTNYKTASGELIADEGSGTIRGFTEEGYGRKVDGRFVNVHRLLVSGSKVTARNMVVMDGEQGDIISRNGPIARGLRKALKDLNKGQSRHHEAVRAQGHFLLRPLVQGKARDRRKRDHGGARRGRGGFPAAGEPVSRKTPMGGVGPLDRPDPQEHPEGRIDPMDRSAPMEEEARAPKVLRSPTSPTAEEIEEHEAIGHAIHRAWCGHCIRARGLRKQHKATPSRDDRGLPRGEGRGAEGELPNLQVKDESAGMLWASTIPAKGADGFAMNFVLSCLDEMGYKRIVLKSDNEVSIKALKDSVKVAAKVELSLEEGKTGDKPSTGSVESAVKEAKRQCRAMKSALEEKLGKSIPDRNAIWTWLARHACFLISRYRVGPDGRTPYERLKGKKMEATSGCLRRASALQTTSELCLRKI